MIGEGTFGVVYLSCFRKKNIVLKVLKNSSAVKDMRREGNTLRVLAKVPGVPRAYCICSSPVTLIMNFDGPMTLRRALRNDRVNRSQILDVLLQVTRTAQGLHECGMSHNDLKAENVVLRVEGNRYTATTIDFGNATPFRKVPYPALDSQRFPYIAPELGQGCKASPKSGVYFFGRLMAYVVAQVPELKADLEDLIEAALQEDPNKRISFHDLEEGLRKTLYQIEKSCTSVETEAESKASSPKACTPPVQKRKRSCSLQDSSTSSPGKKRQRSHCPGEDDVDAH
ncbi:putative serine/threonine-protein kinase fnkB [Oratosquilla oratoria]|uniref:putative serine/threonine-protein kinase fnkB n=1 Tax=Oratosquilla oratoria TaxID=337810 RepID=UPI003F76BEF3